MKLLRLPAPDGNAGFAQGWDASWARRAEPRELVRLAFHHFHAMVFATCARLSSGHEAEDLTQDVFLALFEQRETLRDAARVPGFLKTCAVRLSWLRLRRSAIAKTARAQVSDPAVDTTSGSPSASLEVRQLLEGLDADERVVVVLRFVEEHTVDEIAELLEASRSTVKRRLLSAHEKVRALSGEVASELLSHWETP